MTDLPLLARLQREAFSGAPWHGPAFRDLLDDLRPEQAAARPIPGAHSIWEIVLHCGTWMRIVRLRLLGAADESPEPGADYPAPAVVGAEAWRDAILEIEEAEARLREMVLRQPGARFDPAGPEYDGRMHAQLLGGIAHLAHHGGQITMLRRAMGLPATAPGR
jgi:uncharacterized damage-inducible protein DinB